MSKTNRYYVRTILGTDEIIVEKSEILIKKDYIINVALRESIPFDMVSETSDTYSKAVKAFIAIETDNLVEAPVLI